MTNRPGHIGGHIKVPHGEGEYAGFQLENEVVSAGFSKCAYTTSATFFDDRGRNYPFAAPQVNLPLVYQRTGYDLIAPLKLGTSS